MKWILWWTLQQDLKLSLKPDSSCLISFTLSSHEQLIEFKMTPNASPVLTVTHMWLEWLHPDFEGLPLVFIFYNSPILKRSGWRSHRLISRSGFWYHEEGYLVQGGAYLHSKAAKYWKILIYGPVISKRLTTWFKERFCLSSFLYWLISSHALYFYLSHWVAHTSGHRCAQRAVLVKDSAIWTREKTVIYYVFDLDKQHPDITCLMFACYILVFAAELPYFFPTSLYSFPKKKFLSHFSMQDAWTWRLTSSLSLIPHPSYYCAEADRQRKITTPTTTTTTKQLAPAGWLPL